MLVSPLEILLYLVEKIPFLLGEIVKLKMHLIIPLQWVTAHTLVKNVPQHQAAFFMQIKSVILSWQMVVQAKQAVTVLQEMIISLPIQSQKNDKRAQLLSVQVQKAMASKPLRQVALQRHQDQILWLLVLVLNHEDSIHQPLVIRLLPIKIILLHLDIFPPLVQKNPQLQGRILVLTRA